MARELGDRRLGARALLALAMVAHFHRDLDRVRLLGEEGVTIAREIGDVHLCGELLDCLCTDGPSAQIRRWRLEALDCFRQTGDDMQVANEMHMMYGLNVHEGLLDEARADITEAIARAEKFGATIYLFYMRTDFGILLLIEGKYADAVPVIRRCLLVARRLGQHLDVSELLFGAACCAAWQGDYDRAARLHGAADTDMTTALGIGAISWAGAEQQLREREQSRLRQLMGDEAFGAAHRSGAGLSRSLAMDLALGRAAPG
jgi:tetratricopeptide (TPR) repeat protein